MSSTCLARYHIKGTVVAITQARWRPTRCLLNVIIEIPISELMQSFFKNAEFAFCIYHTKSRQAWTCLATNVADKMAPQQDVC